MTSARSLAARVAAIEAARRRPGNTMVAAIDRPPRETREQWIARRAAEDRGEQYDSGAVNPQGETRSQWIARRTLELVTPATPLEYQT